METNLVERSQNIFQKVIEKKHILVIVCLVFLSLILSLSYVVIALSSTNINPNVAVMGIDVGRLSKEKAYEKINNYCVQTDDNLLTLKFNEKNITKSFKELNVVYDVGKMVDNAYKVGREGNVFKRLGDIISVDLKGTLVNGICSFNVDKLEEYIEDLEQEVIIEPKSDFYEIVDNKLVFYYGYKGKGIDKNKTINEIEEKINKGKEGVINLKLVDIEPEKITADSISSRPKDADYIIENNNIIKYIPETYGLIFDKVLFEQLQKQNEQSKKSFSIPVSVLYPDVFVKDLKSKIFADELSSYETYFGSSTQNRKDNIILAAAKIDGTILAPGDEFSYNKIVGPRTPDKGFKKAHVFSNGRVIDDFGGGICQVSTTLYNVVLKADFDVTERKNHMFTVSYVPIGMDATVTYGIDDFKFKNNSNWPIKIINNTTSTNTSFTIVGTETNKGKTVEFRKEILKVFPPPIKEIHDGSLYQGETVVVQRGQEGYSVNTYKIIKQNGEFVKEEFLYKDNYSPMEKIVKVGTKPNPTDINKLQENQQPVNSTNPSNSSQQLEEIQLSVPVIEQNDSSSILG